MKKLLSLMLALTLVFVACGDEDTGGNSGSGELELKYPIEVVNEGDAIEGGRLQYALVSDTPFAGTLDVLWYEGNPDAEVMEFFYEPLYLVTNDREYYEGETDQAAAWYEMSDDLSTRTIHINEGVLWHDGEELDVDDIIFAMEVLADPDYTGVRLYEPWIYIEGIMDYHEGKADTISGINRVDDYTVEITFDTITDNYLYASEYYLPKHLYEGIEVKDMAQSDPVRVSPVGIGAFKVSSIVPGEAVKFDAFEDYYLGRPKMDGVDLKVVSDNVVIEAFNSGEIDLASTFPTTNFKESALNDNTSIVQRYEAAYNYVGFKLGEYDKDTGLNTPDPDAKMADVELRRAMGYAVDYAAIGSGLYDDLRMAASSIIPPIFEKYYNPDFEGFMYDVDKANEILDDAGYEDTDGDGFRETPDGEELVINVAAMSGPNQEDFANFFLQGWEDAGLKAELTDGRLMEFNSFYDRVKEDDPAIDVYLAAWGTGYNPNPQGLWGEEAQFNYTRYGGDEEVNDLFDRINSEEALMDADLQKELYEEWEQMMFEKVIGIPFLYRTEITPVNNRIKEFNWSFGSEERVRWYEMELTEEDPIK